ncbi:MAG TPA: hypothetical protein VH560_04100 [Polyangia bacterium]|jgi:hypothetical protein|nr:hypothetical protein [Polyangia bacterium]
METLIKGGGLRIAAVAGMLFPALALSACNHPPGKQGDVDLIATLPDGVDVESLAFVLSGNGAAPRAGALHLSKAEQPIEKLITGVPGGDDYALGLDAKSVDGQFACSGDATAISVRQGAVTRVHVALACVNENGGNIVINVGVVACTGGHLVNYTVSPLTASVGDKIAVTATTLKADAGVLTYEWSAPSGAFANPSSAQTTYQCEAAGHVTISLRVTGSSCAEDQSVDVDCVAPSKDAETD